MTVRYGLVGVSGRGSTHASYAAGHDDATVVAGADVDEDALAAFAGEYDAETYTDVEAMLADADLDAVSICTPSGLHGEAAIAAAAAGVSALVEKPLDVHLETVDEMVAAADEHGVRLGCIFQRRFTPERWTAREWVEDGRFGDLMLADTAVKWHRPQSYYEGSWHGTRDMDGGVLLQQAVHFVDLVQWLAGGVDRVYASAGTLAHDMECEDVAVVNLELSNGGFGAIEATTAVKGGNDRIELNGTEGSYDTGTFYEGHDEVEPDLSEPPVRGTEGQVRDFVEAVRDDRPPVVDGAEAVDAVEVVMAAYASATLEEPVPVDDVRDYLEYT
ncbi:MAG: Gfo/Idh/MocA family protein [Halobacteriaceae archaeon]